MDDKNTLLILNAIKDLKTSVDAIETRLDALENCVTRIEVEHGEKLQIALEHISISIEKDEELKITLDKINSKLDNHEIRIEILEEKVC